jgi:hypothetical protein
MSERREHLCGLAADRIERLEKALAELLAADDALAAFLVAADAKNIGEAAWRGQHNERSIRRYNAIVDARAAMTPGSERK